MASPSLAPLVQSADGARYSVSAGNGFGGILVVKGGLGTTTVMIDRSAVVNNNIGIAATGGAAVLIGDSTVTGNSNAGLATFDPGQIIS